MGQEYNARSFRSGNSVAIRIPAALGVEPGADWTIVAQGDDLVLRRKEPARRTIDVSGFAGKAPWLKPLPPELREFEERPSAIAARGTIDVSGFAGKAPGIRLTPGEDFEERPSVIAARLGDDNAA